MYYRAMNKRTNLHLNFINVFGEESLIEVIEEYKNIEAPSHIIPISNPIARFLKGTTYTKYGKLYAITKLNVPGDDFMYFKLVSVVIKSLQNEIADNPSYKKQVMKKILHRQFGPMLSALNELLAAAYYKHLGLDVKLNSSAESGAADVDIINTKFATDAKLYPNDQIRLEALVNESADQLRRFVRKVKDSSILLSVWKPDKRLFHQALEALDKEFDDIENFKSYSDEALHAMPIFDDYRGGDYGVRVHENNVNIFIQPSWSMDDSIEEMKKSIEKAEQQATALGKEAIPWVMVPGDANKHGIQIQAMRHIAKFHPFIMERKNIYVMPVYSFGFENEKMNFIFDIYQTGSNIYNINSASFEAFVRSLMDERVVVL